jgi:hypothetical protein
VPATVRRVLGVVAAVLGGALAIFGAWNAFSLGPSGEARFSVTAKDPGILVVQPDVLNAVEVPVRITVRRSDGGEVLLVVAPSVDARAVLARSAVSTVSGVHYPAGTLDLRLSGTGAPTGVGTADVWRLSAKGAGSAQLVVSQGFGPEAAVVASGDASPLRGVTMTLTWADRAWFFDALAVALVGSIVAAFALSDLWHARAQSSSIHSGSRHRGVIT